MTRVEPSGTAEAAGRARLARRSRARRRPVPSLRPARPAPCLLPGARALRDALRGALVGVALLALAAGAAAQYDRSDPRWAPDPRDIPDPRASTDPRETERDPRELPTGEDLFGHYFEAEAHGELRVALYENPWIVLPWIEGFVDRWLGGADADVTSPAERDELARRARLAASLADDALRDTRFGAYMEQVLTWSSDERAAHREREQLTRRGLDLYNGATTAREALLALTPLHQASEHARRLGDLRGMAATLEAIGRVQAASGLAGEARSTLEEAVRIGRQVRDHDAVWSSLSLLYEAAMASGEYPRARRLLQDQYLIAQDSGDTQAADDVLLQIVELDIYLEDPGRFLPPNVPLFQPQLQEQGR